MVKPTNNQLDGVHTPLKMGVVGLGKMGLLHAAIFNSLPDSRVVAVAEPASLPRQALSSYNKSIQLFPNLEKMLENCEVDAVAIATPVADHVPSALLCAEKGIPFFLEKPLTTSADLAIPLVKKLDSSKLPHMIGFMTRFIDGFEKGKEVLSSNCLGRLQRVTATIYVSQLFKKGKGWRYDRKISGGGALLSQGSHLIDILTWYFGPVAQVNAQMFCAYTPEIEDFSHVMLQFRSGLQGWMDSSWSVRFRRTVEITIDILGDNGSLVVSDDTVNLYLDKGAGGYVEGRTIWRAPDLFRGVPFDVGGPQYTREDLSFINAIKSNSKPQPDIHQAMHVQKIVDASYLSWANRGAPIEVNND